MMNYDLLLLNLHLKNGIMEDFNLPSEINWTKELNCGITVCNNDGVIIYMNEKAIEQKHGNLVGNNVFDCHNPNSCHIIRELLASGGQHLYTIEKKGVKKLIYQSAWKINGAVAGLIEIMAEFSGDIPHFIR